EDLRHDRLAPGNPRRGRAAPRHRRGQAGAAAHGGEPRRAPRPVDRGPGPRLRDGGRPHGAGRRPRRPGGRGHPPEQTVRTVPVALGARSYDVHVGEGALPKAAGLVPDIDGCERVAIVSDANVDRAWGDTAAEAFAPLGSTGEVERLVVDAGETSKSMQRVGALLEELASRKVRRSDL